MGIVDGTAFITIGSLVVALVFFCALHGIM